MFSQPHLSLVPKQDKLFVYTQINVKSKKDLPCFLNQENYFNNQSNSLKIVNTFIDTNILSVVNRSLTCYVNSIFVM